ncbi:MAG: hypothetical protein KAY24_12935 [Candidatus Eisenbacteria sp.]|nr:hypothetical protein [Candidatus Eisenbacteria bacterium]
MRVLRRQAKVRSAVLLALSLVIVLLIPQCLLFPEEGFQGERTKNESPTVFITGGVVEDGKREDKNTVHFYWHGTDTDGVVRFFEWAIDDTVSENAWHETTAFDEVIPFQAATLETVDGKEVFTDWHAFFVRSVDNDYARSTPAKRYFNARTIAPTTTIIRPQAGGTAITPKWARSLRVTWLGHDADATSIDKLPVWFELKFIRVTTGGQLNDADKMRQLFENAPNLLLGTLPPDEYPDEEDQAYLHEAEKTWLRVPGTTDNQWLTGMEVGIFYAFAVRAIDEAGAVELDLQRSTGAEGNWVGFQAGDKNIEVIISEPSLGMHRFLTGKFEDEKWVVTVAPEQRIRFIWEGDATGSGTDPGPCDYGLDLPDPDDDSFRSLDGRGGWIGWATRDRMQATISFPRSDEGTTHDFYMKMRDISNNPNTETRCHVEIKVADFSFTRKFLIIDDLPAPAPRSGMPYSNPDWETTDEETDSWRFRVFSAAKKYLPAEMPVDSIDVHETFGTGDIIPQPAISDNFLELLGRYQNVIWDTGSGCGLRTAAQELYLSRYVGLGGNLMLLAYDGPVRSITARGFSDDSDTRCATTSTTIGEYWNSFGFLWQYLRLEGCLDIPRGTTNARVIQQTLVAAMAMDPNYPDLSLDVARWGSETRGIRNYECLVPDPDHPGAIPWYERLEVLGGMELLYAGQTFRPGSKLDGMPVAWKTQATDQEIRDGSDRGRVVCFSFNLYYFEESSVKGAMTLALTWLVEGKDL